MEYSFFIYTLSNNIEFLISISNFENGIIKKIWQVNISQDVFHHICSIALKIYCLQPWPTLRLWHILPKTKESTIPSGHPIIILISVWTPTRRNNLQELGNLNPNTPEIRKFCKKIWFLGEFFLLEWMNCEAVFKCRACISLHLHPFSLCMPKRFFLSPRFPFSL